MPDKELELTTPGASVDTTVDSSAQTNDEVAEQKAPEPGCDEFDVVVSTIPSLRQEAKSALALGAPSVLIQVLLFIVWAQTAAWVGRTQGTVALTAVTVGNLVGNLTGLSACLGLLTALETLGAHALGRGEREELGLLSQRAAVCCLAVFSLIATAWVFAEPVLLALGQPADTSRRSAQFLHIFTLAMPQMIGYEILRRFLWIQDIVLPFIAIGAVAALLVHPVALYLLTRQFGFPGAPLAHLVSNTSLLALSLAYVCIRRPHHADTWPGLSRRALLPRPLWDFIKLGVPGMFSMSEWWYWEVTALLSGGLGTTSLAAHTVPYNFIPLGAMIPIGMSIGLSTRLGVLIGMGHVKLAKQLSALVLATGVAAFLIYAAPVLLFPHQIVGLFTQDPDVIPLALDILPFAWCFLLCDNININQGAILRALGLQFRLSLAVVGSLWMIGLPIMYWAAHRSGMGLRGLWIVLPSAYVLMNIALFMSYATTNWKRISDRVRAHDAESYGHLDED